MIDNSIFKEEIKDMFVFNIPHSSIKIPYKTSFISDKLLMKEIQNTTDFGTDQIFNVENIDKVVCDFNRAFCDVERFIDPNDEEMSKIGRGFYYTKTFNNETLRNDNEDLKDFIIKNYYKPYHNELENLINKKIKDNNKCVIVDCHSFNRKRLPFEQKGKRPDICLGTTTNNTSNYLLNSFKKYFELQGFNVDINNPYSGSYLPLNCIDITKVDSIMIEINKKLYMYKDKKINTKKVIKLNNIIKDYFDYIV